MKVLVNIIPIVVWYAIVLLIPSAGAVIAFSLAGIIAAACFVPILFIGLWLVKMWFKAGPTRL